MQDNATPSKAGKAKGPTPVNREDRLKLALKANMARRKAQARARAATDFDGDADKSADIGAHREQEDE